MSETTKGRTERLSIAKPLSRGALSAEILRQLLDYDPGTGVFRWKVNRGRVKHGDIAGSYDRNLYVSIEMFGYPYLAHRLAWLYTYGIWPKQNIDHINRKPYDNRISNLRDVGHKINAQNAKLPKTNKTGIVGVYWCKKQKKFRATICVNYKTICLGSFVAIEDAVEARKKAETEQGYGRYNECSS